MIEGAKRLHTVEEYYFSKKLREVNMLKAAGKPIINLGIGSPDLQPPQKVITAITEGLQDANAHKYQSYQGLPELREAMAGFYREQFQVHLSPMTEILPLMGSKEGIMLISMAYLNEGDEVLIPNPGYPTYQSVTKLLGAKPVFYELDEANNWMPNIMALEKQDLSKVKLMWISYPHMPTGAQANYKVFEKLIDFAKRNNILLVNDNPYSFILTDAPRSILKVNGAKEVCIELNSLSKTFNMAGWRVGMVLGDGKHINNILKVKSNMDSGMFYGIQKGAIEALRCSKLWYLSLNSVYEQRRALVWKLAEALNCTYDKNASGLFVWAKLPPYAKAEEFIDVLLKNNHLFVAPGTIFGSQGEGYIRFSLCASTEDIQEAITRVL
ncbi:aminotransferase class I/II-fold pyridoxal phosphate-dependent enzyme [Flavobacteriaceae bacterium S0825]|uniref:pyridoxal phosphate-dependent aminotransferase n=1 Tax=Gaetbulibacter sp. S0825 TaxID=2720084 RepID=UPI0014322E89|nr:aminotransferase class I/II-fold pyridoxal phosphate-dependent enzyme [Gaetbulibacter sp. S0825]MCK0108618.1 aminotransferase class I/II-fold pyridoxal phosphate-dependent enzyme [Flavobacteriaceae bacterium S0825]NIX64254.1 aminotransferase class I/II-fold pyridoxal phosphate-dependent enzyme [Gaetbulibacter sp. S0825]